MVERIKAVMAHYQLRAAQFSDAIGMQRSAVSHVLSGRNKPSLDFVMKLVQAFPDANLYWLLKGEGEFPATSPSMESGQAETSSSKADVLPSPQQEIQPSLRKEIPHSLDPSKIVLFYPDGSFQTYNPKND